jgi:hypothetical protein
LDKLHGEKIMEKFVRSKLYHNNMSYEERIKHNINLAKEVGTILTWKQSKEMCREIDKQEIWVNDIYQVNVLRGSNCDDYIHAPELKGKCDYLSIKTHNKEAIHDWRHFQIIKNELCGEDREAVEIYPSEERLVDTANQYHLWVLPKNEFFPFGFKERKVNYTSKEGGFMKTGQRGI